MIIEKYRIIIAICLILIVTSAVLSPCLKNDFTNWDDESYVIQNKEIRELSWSNIKQIFSSFYVSLYLPLTMLSYSIEYHFFGLDPAPYHTTNLLLHLLNSLLVFWMIFMLSNKVSISLIVGLLFGIHPLHVESVAWISERKDVLSSFFFLGTIICYLYYLKNIQTKKWLYLSLILFVLSLLSKAMAIPLPFLLILIDYLFYKKIDWNSLKEKIPFFVIAIIFSIIAMNILKQEPDLTLVQNIFFASYGFLFIFKKIIVPTGLSCFYARPEGLHYLVLLSPLIVGISVAITLFLGRFQRKIIFGVLFFLITILPVSQFIRTGHVLTADRYTYIPSIGIFYIVAEGFYWLFKKHFRYTKTIRDILIIVLFGTISILSFLTWHRCQIWKDSLSLWDNVLKKYSNIAVAYNNRGVAYIEKKEYNKAIADLINATLINPRYEKAYSNLCKVYRIIGEYEKAILSCKKALEISPHFLEAYNNLGDTYTVLGKYKEELEIYNKEAETNPNNTNAHYNLCSTYWAISKYEKAINACKKSIEIKPLFLEAYDKLGNIYLTIGKHKEAIELYKKTLEINPDLASAHNNLAVIYYYTKQYGLSVKHTSRAIELGHKVHPEFLELLKPYKK